MKEKEKIQQSLAADADKLRRRRETLAQKGEKKCTLIESCSMRD